MAFEIPKTMFAIVTTGNGGYDKLQPQTVPVPTLEHGEVLLRVLAAGVNNTEINTRLGWYSSSVTTSTDAASDSQNETQQDKPDGGWSGATPFPIIQGTDCCGEVVQISPGCDTALLGQRVIVRACMRTHGFDSFKTVWMASNFDGAFAQYVKVPASEVFGVNCNWSDAELATIPCAYATSETMLHRTNLGPSDHVLVTGASGGVGSATVQLAKRRGARITAITSTAKMDRARAIGADTIIDRNTDIIDHLGENAVDVVIDNVAGPNFPNMLTVLKRGGRYASSGAIAGPMVELDMRDMYLKDITLFGSTAWDEPVFKNLVSYIEAGEIRPLLAKTFPLEDIVKAPQQFRKQTHFGNFVLLP